MQCSSIRLVVFSLCERKRPTKDDKVPRLTAYCGVRIVMRKQRPIILGIVGDSAAGKSTITSGLVKLLGPERVTHICTDDYHRYDRRERAQLNITALHPDCNYLMDDRAKQ